MIYADHDSKYDDETVPEKRPGELCLNCNCKWGSHKGWCCEKYFASTKTENFSGQCVCEVAIVDCPFHKV